MEQIAFADRILLNKCDLVESEAELVDVENRIRIRRRSRKSHAKHAGKSAA
ncbi:MAG: GTP-binding protein [Henriciella sp.]